MHLAVWVLQDSGAKRRRSSDAGHQQPAAKRRERDNSSAGAAAAEAADAEAQEQDDGGKQAGAAASDLPDTPFAAAAATAGTASAAVQAAPSPVGRSRRKSLESELSSREVTRRCSRRQQSQKPKDLNEKQGKAYSKRVWQGHGTDHWGAGRRECMGPR